MGELQDYQQRGIIEAVSRRTLAVSPKEGTELATAVAVEFMGKRYIVTARHVVRDRDLDDVFFLFRLEEPFTLIQKADLPRRMIGTKVRERFQLPLKSPLESVEEDDLAVFQIESLPDEIKGADFHTLERSRVTPSVGTAVLVFGFPTELVRRVPGGQDLGTFPQAEWSEIVEPRQGLLAFESERHFLIDFTREGTSPDVADHPSGMSGAGVWTYPAETSGAVWDPRSSYLVGIQTGWYKGFPQRLKATRVERLIKLIESGG
jgi:hypothetical protein